MTKLFLAALLLIALAASMMGQSADTQSVSANQSPQETGEREQRAREELLDAASAYKAGDFAEAQRHSERALELNPAEKIAPFFIARSIHAQFRQGIDTPQNIGKAREAIAAYRRILARWPDNEEAFNAIGFLYGALNEAENQREWVNRRAVDSTVSPEKRAKAYVFLASKDWDCSYQITEDSRNKYSATEKGKTVISFRKPENWEDFNQAMLCTTKGLEEIETALALNPDDEKAWSYKAALLYEAQKLAEMDGKLKRALRFYREGEAARKRTRELNTKKQAEEKARDSATVP